MKRAVKITLRISGVVLILILIAALIFGFNFYKATRAMTPSETAMINDSVWVLKDRFVNAFVFRNDNGYMIIDAGMSQKNIGAGLAKLGIDPARITTLLLTHTDGDHTGATALFTNAAILMHCDEEQMVNGTTGKTKFWKTKWKYAPYKLFNSSDLLEIDGLKIKVYHTPGHTPGSCCFAIGSDYLATGDNLVVKDGAWYHFIEAFNMNTTLQSESLKILPPPSEFKYILTSHNGVVKMN
jgi:glyoxylase-like metal-dependent hydrolase (beta-lactamase superfamily II)